MTKAEQLWGEYQSLREEIRGADTVNFQVLGILVGAAALILTAGFGQPKPTSRLLMFLCIFAVTIPVQRFLEGNRRRVWRISTYMRVFLEGGLQHVHWETRLAAQHVKAQERKEAKKLSSWISTNEAHVILTLEGIAVLAALSTLSARQETDLSLNVLGGAAVFLLFVARLWMVTRVEQALGRGGEVESLYLKSWKELQQLEEKTEVTPETSQTAGSPGGAVDEISSRDQKRR